MTLIITTCSSRKRVAVPGYLRFGALPPDHIDQVAAEWFARLTRHRDRVAASGLYAGRAFREASAAARAIGARLLIASAGLGLVDASDEVPPYACTVAAGKSDSISERVTGPFSAAEWWSALQRLSPFGSSIEALPPGPILLALSEPYVALISARLETLGPERLREVRILTRCPAGRLAPVLRPLVMPYDDRLDGAASPIPGTRGDFAQRALRHFVTLDRRAGDPDHDVRQVSLALEGRPMPVRPVRRRVDDQELRSLIREHWVRAGRSTGRLLRILRDELGVSCEQTRFHATARHLAPELVG